MWTPCFKISIERFLSGQVCLNLMPSILFHVSKIWAAGIVEKCYQQSNLSIIASQFLLKFLVDVLAYSPKTTISHCQIVFKVYIFCFDLPLKNLIGWKGFEKLRVVLNLFSNWRFTKTWSINWQNNFSRNFYSNRIAPFVRSVVDLVVKNTENWIWWKVCLVFHSHFSLILFNVFDQAGSQEKNGTQRQFFQQNSWTESSNTNFSETVVQ